MYKYSSSSVDVTGSHAAPCQMFGGVGSLKHVQKGLSINILTEEFLPGSELELWTSCSHANYYTVDTKYEIQVRIFF
jgi:hypothetical protein